MSNISYFPRAKGSTEAGQIIEGRILHSRSFWNNRHDLFVHAHQVGSIQSFAKVQAHHRGLKSSPKVANLETIGW